MNTYRCSPSSALLVLALSLIPLLAQAHPGHGDGFGSGLAHPLQGIDHLLAMLAVGMWAGQLTGRARWAVPTGFLGVMAFGSVLGMAGISLPFLEAGILVSVVLLGLLIAVAARLPLAATLTLIGFFAAVHGLAHGAEIPSNVSGASYVAGFSATTAALLVVGFGLMRTFQRSASLNPSRLAGATVAFAGVMLAFG